MIEATGRLDIDGRGGCDYYGDFAGLAFLDQISRRCTQLLNPNLESEISSQLFPPRAFTLLSSGLGSVMAATLKKTPLPPKTVALRLTDIALGDACCLLKFVHQPSFISRLHRIYDIPLENYLTEDGGFLPLLYMALAVGELYSKDPPLQVTPVGEDDSIKGYVSESRFFAAGFH
jgi:hypothetical protein